MRLLVIGIIVVVVLVTPEEAKKDKASKRSKKLERACAREREILAAEDREAKQSKKDKHSDSRVFAFLSSNPQVKSLSEYAIIQLAALEECKKEDFPSATCEEFWENVHKGGCGDARLEPNDGSLTCDGSTDSESSESASSSSEESKEKGRGKKGERKRARKRCDMCPFSHQPCPKNPRYRTIDGCCNNLDHPNIGQANRAYRRLLPAAYKDCVQEPRSDLPSARAISLALYRRQTLPKSGIHTTFHMIYGQLLDHDIDRTAISKFRNEETGELVNVKCGDDGCQTSGPENHECFPIPVSSSDPKFGDKACLKFVRSQEFMHDDCELSPREQANQITAWLDASFVYGSDIHLANSLRTFSDGLLRTSAHPYSAKDGSSYSKGFMELLPTQNDTACRNTSKKVQCFLTGDARQNEHVGLIAAHTLFTRYHNHIARNLKEKHGKWKDEKLYQHARKILYGVWQHTVFNEYLFQLLGKHLSEAFDLLPQTSGYYNGYEPDIQRLNPDVFNAFATAAFRCGHSQIGDTLRFSDPSLTEQEDIFFSHVFFNPNKIYKSGIRNNKVSGTNAVIIGMTSEPADKADIGFTAQICDCLFTDTPPKGPGTDLPALNTQRGRDHGLQGYVAYRHYCRNQIYAKRGLTSYMLRVVNDFSDLTNSMPPSDVAILETLYSSVADIDLFVGAMMEDPVDGGMLGPTFACLVALQFQALKKGDRFYYENEPTSETSGFNRDQLDNIREQTITSILCQTMEDKPNSDLELRLQKYAMLQPQAEAFFYLANSGVSNMEIEDKLELYRGEGNERKACSQHSKLNFNLF